MHFETKFVTHGAGALYITQAHSTQPVVRGKYIARGDIRNLKKKVL
jgi:hypothetical protein